VSQPRIVRLDYDSHPKQKILHGLKAQEIMYGGAAGGGKSHGLRWDAYDVCLKNAGCDAYLFRRTRTDLENTHIKRVLRELPEWCGAYSMNRNRYEFFNGSYLNMCYAEHEEDVFRYDSVEFHWLGVDEAGHFSAEQLGYLKTRLRVGGWKYDPAYEGFFPRMILTANPGGISHNYLKKKYISGKQIAKITIEGRDYLIRYFKDESGIQCAFIPASMRDNPTLATNYDKQFADVPEWKRKQLVDGDWDVVPGAFFDCWDVKKHIIRPFTVPQEWARFRALDWGFTQPFWIGEFAVSDGNDIVNTRGETVNYPEGAVICIWEWYGGRNGYGGGNKGLQLDASEVAKKIVRERGKVSYTVAGRDTWNADNGPSSAEKFQTNGLPLAMADVKQGTRVPGWQHCYLMLKSGMFFSFETNDALNSCIPSLEADPDKPDDVNKKGEDHPGDAWRYALMSRPRNTVIEKQDPPPMTVAPTFNDVMKRRKKPERMRICH
jgi:hypothetical protein